ncbi:Hypothetical predicted protein [Olea europaea subsp. europaea]|uniref:Uncharacterized protein n=2 Tax=Olea europaea subsp. europaea TaxID=158383 RepID=A0A8S0R9L9_OLEEU|nr:Hypothetical predicted protein [Olea europaea subsp. europaea]
MEYRTSSSTKSMKTLCFVLLTIVSIMTSQMGSVQCRTIHMAPEIKAGSMNMTPFSAASNTSSHISPRLLAFILASGPSKRGPGH